MYVDIYTHTYEGIEETEPLFLVVHLLSYTRINALYICIVSNIDVNKGLSR